MINTEIKVINDIDELHELHTICKGTPFRYSGTDYLVIIDTKIEGIKVLSLKDFETTIFSHDILVNIYPNAKLILNPAQ